MQGLWAVGGSRGLCRSLVNHDFSHAHKLLAISPSLINIRHPLGWTPLHAVILCGDPSLVKFVLDLPGIDITIKDSSAFNATSSAADILCRQEELCPNIYGWESTSGATALHFACMRGDWDILKLLLEMPVLHDVQDDLKRLPLEYFDLERVDIETFEAYHAASKAWRIRWRSLAKKDMMVLCDAIREGDHDYCKEILDVKPKLAYGRHPNGWRTLHVAVMNRKPSIVDLILSRSTAALNKRDSWDDSDNQCAPFASNRFPHWGVRRLTALHYACLLDDMEIVEVLLRHGAQWAISDSIGLLPEHYINVTNGDGKKHEFKRLCEEETLKQLKKHEQEDELRRAKELEEQSKQSKKLAEEEALKQSEKREQEDELRRAKELEEEESMRSKKVEEEELMRLKKVEEEDEMRQAKELEEEELMRSKKVEEELLKRRMRQKEIERVIGDKIIGQRGPIRSVASAIRLRENGWVDPDRPLVMLFLGSSGIGKTELAKQVTYFLHGDESKDKTSCGQSLVDMEKSGAFMRIDMSEYQHDHTVSNLTGSPKGYVGYDEGGILTKGLQENPRAIVLLDEIEKAHPDVLTVFLQVFDDGRITDPKLGTIYCKGAVFIMTSNLGSEEIRAASPRLHKLVATTEDRHEQYLKGIGQFTKQLYPVLKESLRRDEFLGRINQIVVFLPLSDQEISQVIEIELKKWKKRAVEHHGIRLSWSPEVVQRLVEGYDVNYGARSVMNEAQTLAIQILAESQIRGDIGKDWLVHLFINDAGDIDMAKEDPTRRIPQGGCHYVF